MGQQQQQPDDEESLDSLEVLRQAVSATTKPKASSPVAFLCLDVAQKTGLLAEVLQWKGEDLRLDNDEELRRKVESKTAGLLISILALSVSCGIDLGVAAQAKMRLNARKYPALLVKGQAHKYSHYSAQTGVEKEGQTLGEGVAVFHPPPWDGRISLSGLQAKLQQFVAERDWGKYHTPRNLLLALVGEMGELCEIVQTLKGAPAAWPKAAKDELAQEVADVFIYLLRFSDVCHVDLGVGLREAIAARQNMSTKQGWGGQMEEEVEEEQMMIKRKGLASSNSVGWMLSGVAAACVGAALLQQKR